MSKVETNSVMHNYVPIPNKLDKGVVATATRTPAALVVGLGQAVISAGYTAWSNSRGRSLLGAAMDSVSALRPKRIPGVSQDVEARPEVIDRHDYTRLWSLQLGDYFMPLSQTFTLKARKHLNVSSLVDGIDIIQQTRKQAKTVDCTLRLTLRDNQTRLMIEKVKPETYLAQTGFDEDDYEEVQSGEMTAQTAIDNLATFLNELYEDDAVFIIRNKMINETFGIQYVFMSEYEFNPKAGMGTFEFKFSLTEVKFGDDVLTFNVKEIGGDNGANVQ